MPPVEWDKKSVWLLTIDPGANWEDFMTKIRFKDLTQVSFGGDYEQALLYAAGGLPPRTESQDDLTQRNPVAAGRCWAVHHPRRGDRRCGRGGTDSTSRRSLHRLLLSGSPRY